MTESIFINDIEYNIEDEELEEISYYEILTLKEIIKDNPTFIAFSREELINELNIIYKDFDKSRDIAELFFKDNNLNLQNIIFVTDAQRIQNDCDEDSVYKNFIEFSKKMNKLQPEITKKKKDNYIFSVEYDNESNKIRLKPHMKTMIDFKENKNDAYIIFPEDDTNIPIFAAYFKQPITTMYDFMTDKVLSHTKGKSDLYNYVYADTYTNMNKLITSVRPKMKLIIEKNKLDDNDDFDFDQHHIDNLLRKFDTSFDEINKDDFQLLRDELGYILDMKSHNIKYKGYHNKKLKYITEKLTFFDKIKNIKKMIDIPEKIKEENDALIASLEEQKFQLNASPLIYNNVKDIVKAVGNGDMSIEDIIDNIDVNRKVIVFDHAITTLKNMNKTNVTEVQEVLDDLIGRFANLRKIKNDLFELHFLDFYKDIKELKEANDYSDYEGIPDVFKNEANFDEQINLEYDIFNETDITSEAFSIMMLEKYWLSQKYKYAKGFVEMLQIVLPIIEKIREISSLEIDYELLCQELYKHFSGISTKYNTLYNLFKKHNINESDENIRNMSRITPRIALTDIVASEYEQFKDVMIYIKECNQQFVQILTDMICMSIAWWSVRVQNDLIEGINAIQENLFQTAYADKWSINGHPLKESDKNQGVTIYLSAITQDVITEEKDYFPSNIKDIKDISKNIMDIKDITKKIINVVKETFQTELEEIRINEKKLSKTSDKGSETYQALKDTLKEKNKDKILINYINALMYMPGYKYKKINKFLLGCCLQRIGKTFAAFSDLKLKDRKDLIAVKNSYAKKRETIKTSKEMFCPVADKKKSKLAEIKYILPIIKMDDVTISTFENWIDNMRKVSPLLPEKVIDKFQKNPRELKTLSDENVHIFCNTAVAKTRTSYFQNQLYQNNSKYSNILRRICTVLKKMNIDRTIEESALLSSAIEVINAIIVDIDKLNEIVNEYNVNDIQNIRYYIISRAICLPFNPDIAKENNGFLYSSITTSETFVFQIVKAMYNSIRIYISNATMPTIEENLDFINKIREENKKKLLGDLNMKSNDERSLIDQLKKIGMKDDAENMITDTNDDYLEPFSLNEMYDTNYQNDEVEDEFLLISQEDDERD